MCSCLLGFPYQYKIFSYFTYENENDEMDSYKDKLKKAFVRGNDPKIPARINAGNMKSCQFTKFEDLIGKTHQDWFTRVMLSQF